MEENVAVESVEVTTPDAVTDTAESPADAETMGETAETQSTEPATEGGEGTTPPSEAAEEATPITVPVRYKHESRALTLDEASAWSQKGMCYEPVYEDIRRLAVTMGKSVPEFVETLKTANEHSLYDRLLEEAGGNEDVARRLLELEKQKFSAAYDASKNADRDAEKSETTALQERLAADFEELSAEYPEVTEFKQIPQAVVKLAIDKKIPLMDAYARHLRAESKKISAAAQSAATAATASTGSQAGAADEHTADAAEAAFLRGLGAAMR